MLLRLAYRCLPESHKQGHRAPVTQTGRDHERQPVPVSDDQKPGNKTRDARWNLKPGHAQTLHTTPVLSGYRACGERHFCRAGDGFSCRSDHDENEHPPELRRQTQTHQRDGAENP